MKKKPIKTLKSMEFLLKRPQLYLANPFSITIYDPLHSKDEDRFVILGLSNKNRLLVVVHTDRDDRIRIISARKATKKGEKNNMKVINNDPDMLEEYDFNNGVRGKYTSQYKEGTNMVRLDPELIEYFPDSASVNEALKSLVKLIKSGKNRKAGQIDGVDI